MTKDQFISLLRSPSTINLNLVRDLEDITEQFPYFQNAHLLLAKQYHGHENIRFESYLRKASAYAPDRTILHKLINMEPAEVIHMEAEKDPIAAEIKPTDIHETISYATPQTGDLNDVPVNEIQESLTDVTHEITAETYPGNDISHMHSPLSEDADPVIEDDVAMVPDEEIFAPNEEDKKVESANESSDPMEIINNRLRELNISTEENENAENVISGSETINKEENKKEENIPVNIEERIAPETTLSQEIVAPEVSKDPEEKSNIEILPSQSFSQISGEVHSFTEWLKIKNSSNESVPVTPEFSAGVLPNDSTSLPSSTKKSTLSSPLVEKFIREEPRIVPLKSEFYSPGNMARQSVVEHEDLISETLARIYAQQGNLRKAAETYTRLSLKFPEKSAYFASLIEKLGKIED